ncbi:IS6 family transposase [Wolbachia endosymbiont of Diaphorina citri]|uniref:IS6 family transposase n=1 Tax=Wolbachia endosymbiont of Diaphorina citri TaxID=116598 RepID=UPI00155E746B|nr:IS6 family transposase [Wolbachia endosymbiont of Diaphorina citri]QJT94939.1 IS6 family transposase [Wolbachia endosymbiont of Diaphorina citri]QJT95041.1 IS6 family transposase [Wolbachia endosymbiont of Diaphorina citri]QJT95042.1 IS6 family transposase [Wolbachia endosymbiont of Diaphorina citri]QJT96040.1 IS6 family transposase [Wolbachia endosymbiont of Diaphorina citri]QJT96284.1 IS6 family transposase [Wolbachia endosymbiont of Diaphorina citri]
MLRISPKLLPYFKGFSFSAEIIMLSVYMKCRFSLSYRDLEEMMSIRGAKIDHATLQRWIIRFVPLIDEEVRKRKKQVGSSWRMDETYIKLNGKWVYLYRALDSLGNTVDFLMCTRRDKSAALAFFRKAFRRNNLPEKVVIDKSGSNIAAIDDLNTEIPEPYRITVFQVRYLNNIVEQDHRFIKKLIKPMLGFKSFHSAKITITGIENIRMIQKRQIIKANDNGSTFENFAMLMAL